MKKRAYVLPRKTVKTKKIRAIKKRITIVLKFLKIIYVYGYLHVKQDIKPVDNFRKSILSTKKL